MFYYYRETINDINGFQSIICYNLFIHASVLTCVGYRILLTFDSSWLSKPAKSKNSKSCIHRYIWHGSWFTAFLHSWYNRKACTFNLMGSYNWYFHESPLSCSFFQWVYFCLLRRQFFELQNQEIKKIHLPIYSSFSSLGL